MDIEVYNIATASSIVERFILDSVEQLKWIKLILLAHRQKTDETHDLCSEFGDEVRRISCVVLHKIVKQGETGRSDLIESEVGPQLSKLSFAFVELLNYGGLLIEFFLFLEHFFEVKVVNSEVGDHPAFRVFA